MAFVPSKSLRFQITARAVATTVIAVVVLTIASAIISNHLESRQTASDLVDVANQVTRATTDANSAIGSDARILANMPPVAALIRASRNNGVDPLSGDTVDEWTERLATIFSSFHSLRPNYTQIRFVSFDNNGREIVRVNKQDGALVRVPDDELQTKSNEPYFADAAELAPGEIYVGAPSFNRERGVIQKPHLLVYRVLVPVFDENGGKFGFIAINVDLLRHNAAVYEPLKLESDFVLHNSAGSSYHWNAKTQTGSFKFLGTSALPPEVEEKVVARDGPLPRGLIRVTHDGHDYLSTRLSSLSRASHQVYFTLIRNRNFFQRVLPGSTRTLFLLGLIVIVTSVVLTRRSVDRALDPMINMRSNVMNAATTGRAPSLPVGLQDEVGDLARSFNTLIDRLRDQEASARRVFDAVMDGLVVIRLDGTIENSNIAFQNEFGIVPVSPVKAELSQIMAGSDWAALAAEMADYVAADPQETREIKRLCTGWDRAEREVSLDISISLLPSQNDQPLFVAVVRDVTAAAKMKRDSQALIDRLNRSNQELEEFAYVASHDLKAPLRAISHAATWLEEDLEELLTEETREHLHFMTSRIARMSRLLDDLLLHSRIGSVEFDPTRDIVSGAYMAEDLEKLAGSDDKIKLEFSDDFKAAMMNFMPLRTILLNLIGNSIKHSDKEIGEITVSLEERSTEYAISVRDNGPGIPEKFHEHIFGLFKTLESRDKVEGSGMGLAFVKKHLTILDQNISVVSDGDGTGTEFIFTWPKPEQRGAQNAA
ncbi:sensor histidine kinase [Tritonibacter horizontis]|uniref:histidine kinase n=1 Tax=Tritonibacter horizontis TaxID=1768241 RepID=A0A132BY79_9RHOB|nr:ATP-binding protein [Tritonibacter horizontis]KUP92680.1 phytochrome-like protein cph1 [Tritonibacter horizontis]